MARGRCDSILKEFNTLLTAGTAAGLSDAQLVERFVVRRDEVAEAAFAALVGRHGPMVLRICQQLLGDPHDAEDAFQAAFLVLARRARSIREPELLGSWLYGVAIRTAREARKQNLRRLRHERPEVAMSAEPVANDTCLSEQRTIMREQAKVLHEEVRRLPERYREAVVLCYFEGLTHTEAAHRLRCPEGTVGVRLMRARERLRDRLTRRGLAPSGGLLAVALEPPRALAVVPESLVTSTIQAAFQFVAGRAASAGSVSGSVAALAEGVLKTMFMSKLKILIVVVVAGLVAAGGGVLAQQGTERPTRPKIDLVGAQSEAKNPTGDDDLFDQLEEKRLDLELLKSEVEQLKMILKNASQYRISRETGTNMGGPPDPDSRAKLVREAQRKVVGAREAYLSKSRQLRLENRRLDELQSRFEKQQPEVANKKGKLKDGPAAVEPVAPGKPVEASEPRPLSADAHPVGSAADIERRLSHIETKLEQILKLLKKPQRGQ